MNISNGQIYIADLNPIKGSKQSGKRPVVVVSGDVMNSVMPICIICPLTTSVKNYHSCVVVKKHKTNGLAQDSEILTFQIRTISKDRLIKKLGKITSIQTRQVRTCINDTLSF